MDVERRMHELHQKAASEPTLSQLLLIITDEQWTVSI